MVSHLTHVAVVGGLPLHSAVPLDVQTEPRHEVHRQLDVP